MYIYKKGLQKKQHEHFLINTYAYLDWKIQYFSSLRQVGFQNR